MRSSGSRRSTYPRSTGRTRAWFRTGKPGRDGARVPIPWRGTRSPYGFGPATGDAVAADARRLGALTVAAQRQDPGLDVVVLPSGAAGATPVRPQRGARWRSSRAARPCSSSVAGDLTVVCNCGPRPVRLPAGEVVVASGPLDGDLLPPDTAVWLDAERASGVLVEGRRCSGASPATNSRRSASDHSASCSSSQRRRSRSTASIRCTASGLAEISIARPSSGVGLAVEQPEVAQVLDLAADRALVDVEPLRDHRRPLRALGGEEGEHQVRRGLQVGVDRPGALPDDALHPPDQDAELLLETAQLVSARHGAATYASRCP